jgi:hypothetical protein
MKRWLLVFCSILCLAGWTHGVLTSAPLSKRAGINVTFIDNTYDYQFINHIQVAGVNGVGPVAAYWTTPGANKIWNKSILDANGWPNDASANGNSWGSHILIPASTDYGAGPSGNDYIVQWTGQGQFQFNTGTWTDASVTGTGCARNSNGNWTGTNCRIETAYTGAKAFVSWRVLQTNQSAGGYFRGLQIFRNNGVDETDLLAGKVFRQGYKQKLLTLDPGFIRFMNWTGSNNALMVRFEDRAVPTYATYGGANPTIGPAYNSDTSTSATNALTLAAAATTTASMVHGEFATARIGTGISVSGSKTVTAAAVSTPSLGSTRFTVTSHGYSVGDVVVFLSSFSAGWTKLNYQQVTISNVSDANNFDAVLDTTAFGTFAGSTVTVGKYISLQVGSGNDRVAYPVLDTGGVTPIGWQSNNFVRTTDYRTFYFDKTLFGSRDGSGNPVYGVWLITAISDGGASPYYDTYTPNTPLEICTALINELNAMSPAHPIHMYVTMPARGLMSNDPDYSAGSNYAVNSISVILNGANGYAKLTSAANLYVEYSNETWNATAAATQATYLNTRGRNIAATSGSGNYSYYTTVRTALMVREMQAANSNPRIKYVMAGQGTNGLVYGGGINPSRVYGSIFYFTDPTVATFPTITGIGNTHGTSTVDGFPNGALANVKFGNYISGANIPTSATCCLVNVVGANSITLMNDSGGAVSASGTASGSTFTFIPSPMSYHDYFAHAAYIDPPSTYYSTVTGTGTFTDDSALYNGTDNSGNGGGNYTGAANTTQAVVNYVAQAVNISGASQTFGYYGNLLTAQYAPSLTAIGKSAIQYEGGWDAQTIQGQTQGGHVLTANDVLFTVAVQGSSQWATAQVNYFNTWVSTAGAFLPSLYVGVDQRFGLTSVNNGAVNPDTYSGGVEGAAFNSTFSAVGTNNVAQSN